MYGGDIDSRMDYNLDDIPYVEDADNNNQDNQTDMNILGKRQPHIQQSLHDGNSTITATDQLQKSKLENSTDSTRVTHHTELWKDMEEEIERTKVLQTFMANYLKAVYCDDPQMLNELDITNFLIRGNQNLYLLHCLNIC